MIVLSLFDGQVSLGSVGVILSILVAALVFWRNSPVGGDTVALWQSRAELLERELDDLKPKYAQAVESSHRAELQVKDREKTITALRAQPDTQKMLDAFETNQTAVLRVLDKMSAGLDQLLSDHASRNGTTPE